MDKKIAILSTVVNFELYAKSSRLFPQGIPKYVIDGRNGMHAMDSVRYMFRKLKDEPIDWLIMADEDVLFIQPELVFGCIERMQEQGYSVCGVRDGGVIPHRMQNPYAINTFFSILNFKDALALWNEREVLQHQYVTAGEFDDDLTQLTSSYNAESTFEPYYCFYFWLRRNGRKMLFLDASVPFPDDAITNKVADDLGSDLLYHTWYARSYGSNQQHTARIDAVFARVKPGNATVSAPIIFKDKSYAFRKKIAKFYRRIVNKIKR